MYPELNNQRISQNNIRERHPSSSTHLQARIQGGPALPLLHQKKKEGRKGKERKEKKGERERET